MGISIKWRMLIKIIATFLLSTVFIYFTWNHAVPRLIRSIDPGYNINTFEDIDIVTSLTLAILVSALNSTSGGIYELVNDLLAYEEADKRTAKQSVDTSATEKNNRVLSKSEGTNPKDSICDAEADEMVEELLSF